MVQVRPYESFIVCRGLVESNNDGSGVVSEVSMSTEVDETSTFIIPTEMELCSNAVFACSILLNSSALENDTQLSDAWNLCKQQVIRDLLILRTGQNNPGSDLHSFTSNFLISNFESPQDEYQSLLQSAKEHFGGDKAPMLFQFTDMGFNAEKLSRYLQLITSHKGKRIQFENIPLHLISSVYDEILDYTPTFLESPRKWNLKGCLPVLKEAGGNDEPDLKAGDIGLLRLHSRDNAVSERDKKGAFYTPYAIAYDIAERTLKPLVDGKSHEEILQLRICEPALGSGVFLLAATEFLCDSYLSSRELEKIPPRGLGFNTRNGIFGRGTKGFVNRSGQFGIGRKSSQTHHQEDIERAEILHEILSNCMFGVDIDRVALSVAEGILSGAYQNGTLEPIDFSSKLRHGNSMLGLPLNQWATVPEKAYSNAQKRKNAKKANTTPEQLDVLKKLKTKRKGIEKKLDVEMKNKSSGAKAQRGLFNEIDLEESIREELLESTHQEARIVKEHLEKQRLPNPQSRLVWELLKNADTTSEAMVRDYLDTHLSTWWQEAENTQNDLTTSTTELYLRFLLDNHGLTEGDLCDYLKQQDAQKRPMPEHYSRVLSEARELSQRLNFFHWELEFREIFLGPHSNQGFDAILGNPPWGIDFDAVQRRRFEWAYPLSGDKESAWALLESAMNLVRSDTGRVGFIIPNTFLLNISSSQLRKYISDNWLIEEILDYSDVAIFEGAGVRACQIHICKRQSSEDSRFVLHRPDQAPPQNDGVQIVQSSVHGRSHWGSLEVELNIDPENFIPIGECCLVRQGYKPYVSGKFTARGLNTDEVSQIMKDRPYHHKEKADGRVMQIYGSDVKPFSIQLEESDERWVEHTEGAVAELIPKEFTEGRRIMIREIAGKAPHLIIAAHTELEFVHDPGVIMLRPNQGYEKMYDIIELYLNSSVCENHVKYYSAKAGKGLFAKFTLGDIRQLPLPRMEDITLQNYEKASVLVNECHSILEMDDSKRIEIADFVLSLYYQSEEE